MKHIKRIIWLLVAAVLITGASPMAAAQEAPEQTEIYDLVDTTAPEDGVEAAEPEEGPSPEAEPTQPVLDESLLTTLSPWATEQVLALYGRGAVPAELMSAFTSSITREEFTAIIVLAYEGMAGAPAASAQTTFLDIDGSPYYDYIIKAYGLGIISGRSQEVFDPTALIARQEAAKMLYSLSQALGYAGELSPVELPYEDVESIDSWALEYVAYAYENGLMEGTNLGFEPKGSLTREQSMAIIQRLWTGIETEQFYSQQDLGQSIYRALVVGISDYPGQKNDGERFGNAVVDYVEMLETVTVDGNGYVIRREENILGQAFFAAIDEFFAEADGNDVSLLFLTGHGSYKEDSVSDVSSERQMFVLSDGEGIEGHYFEELTQAMADIPGVRILVVGNCYSGVLVTNAPQDSSLLIVTASAEDEQSFGVSEGGQRAFNIFDRYFVESFLRGEGFYADANGDGAVTFDEAAAYVRQKAATTYHEARSSVQIKSGVEVVLANGHLEGDGGQ